MMIYMLEFYEEITYKDCPIENYKLVGVYETEEEAEKEKKRIAMEKNIPEELLYVSADVMERLQWKGGFARV